MIISQNRGALDTNQMISFGRLAHLPTKASLQDASRLQGFRSTRLQNTLRLVDPGSQCTGNSSHGQVQPSSPITENSQAVGLQSVV
jgi:hypothetical protein